MYKILNQSSTSTEILLYSLIIEGWTANRVIEALNASPSEQITLRINSDGGDVFEAVTLYNYLKDKNVAVLIDGLCASAASIVAMAGRTITMKQGSMLMIHQPLSFGWGNADEMREQADLLDKITASIAGIYAARTGKTPDEMIALMKAESWMNDTEAVDAGFADVIETVKEETSPPDTPLDKAGVQNDTSTAFLMSKGGTRGVVDSAGARESASNANGEIDDAVKAERERLRMLDELNAPGREKIINRAKYETFESAQDIAIELLKAERVTNSRKPDDIDLSSLPAKTKDQSEIDAMVEAINSMRR